MKAADTSVVIAAFAPWHEAHGAALRAVGQRPRLIAHCALEAYSVLTRLPPPHRAPADVVRAFLAARFSAPLLGLSVRAYREFILGLPERGIAGGAAYDALVAATAAAFHVSLLTCDRRATPVYERYRIQVQIL